MAENNTNYCLVVQEDQNSSYWVKIVIGAELLLEALGRILSLHFPSFRVACIADYGSFPHFQIWRGIALQGLLSSPIFASFVSSLPLTFLPPSREGPCEYIGPIR